MMENVPSRIKVDYLHIETTQFGKLLSSCRSPTNLANAVIFFGGGDRLAEFNFQLRFGESPFFGGGGLIRRLMGLLSKIAYSQ